MKKKIQGTTIVPLTMDEYTELSAALDQCLLQLTDTERKVLKAWSMMPYSAPGVVARQLGIKEDGETIHHMHKRKHFRQAVRLLKRLAMDHVMTTQDVRMFLSGVIQGTVYDQIANKDQPATLPDLNTRLRAAEMLIKIDNYSEKYGTAGVTINVGTPATTQQEVLEDQLAKSKYMVTALLQEIQKQAGNEEAVRVLKKSMEKLITSDTVVEVIEAEQDDNA